MGLFDELGKSAGSLFGGNGQNNNQGSGLAGLLGTAAAGGLLGALLGGSKGMKKAAKNTLAVGIGAGGAMLAYKLFQKWRQGSDNNAAGSIQQAPGMGQPMGQPGFGTQGYSTPGFGGSPYPALQSADEQASLLLEAMIFAARADGHIDAEEQKLILQSSAELCPGSNVQQLLQNYLNCPLSPEDLARRAGNMEQKQDLYLLSALIVNPDTFMEQNYLAALAQAMGLSFEQKSALDSKAQEQRKAMLTAM